MKKYYAVYKPHETVFTDNEMDAQKIATFNGVKYTPVSKLPSEETVASMTECDHDVVLPDYSTDEDEAWSSV